ncbi:hypothetical protein [Pedobacter nototheniae]|uniref:hypothetical protein n=1 Tax=Pedobacter nototheniae TaxID=2488994 RepID=UPI00103C5037|nr:hypothetical protein [Pedobacter nototheniae]
MNLLFSEKQQKAINSIWILGTIIAFLQISNYFVDSYGPDNLFYTYLWKSQNWLFESLVFAWYFYSNKLIAKGLIIQLLFLPYYVFKADWAGFLDYHLSIDNSNLIYSGLGFATFVLPLAAFVIFYFKSEIKPAGVSKIKSIIIQVVAVLIFSYTVSSDPDSLYKFIGGFVGSSLYVKDIIVSIIFSLISLKTIAILTGFFYLSNRIYSIKQLVNPLDVQNISASFFKWAFLISYPVLLLMVVDMAATIFSISLSFSSSLKTTAIIYILSYLIVLFIYGRFFANLIQYRNYSLKKYFGVINSLSLLPIFNLIPFFTLIFAKKSGNSTSNYVERLKSNRNIHLIIYCALLTVYTCYRYFSKQAELRDFSAFYSLAVYIVSVLLLARFKLSTKIVPFLAVIILYYADFKDFFDFTQGFLTFIKAKVLSFIWLSTASMFLLYYVVDYILHKCFYTEYFEQHNAEEFEAYIEKFQ